MEIGPFDGIIRSGYYNGSVTLLLHVAGNQHAHLAVCPQPMQEGDGMAAPSIYHTQAVCEHLQQP